MAELNARGGRRRRTRNEMNMVPFIDVMLVLLIIFMVSAPLMPTGVVDLPSVGKASTVPEKVVEVVMEQADRVSLRVNQKEVAQMVVADLPERIKAEQDVAVGGPQAVPVIISARKDLPYEAVMKVMDTLQKAGVARVGLAVRTGG